MTKAAYEIAQDIDLFRCPNIAVDLQVDPNTLLFLSDLTVRVRLSPRIPVSRAGRRGLPQKKGQGPWQREGRSATSGSRGRSGPPPNGSSARGSPRRAASRALGRSPASISDEAKRNRTVAKGPGKGERVEAAPEDACARLQARPWTCNGCRLRRYHCSKGFKCEHSATRAQALADGLLSEARRGVNAKEYDFERAMELVRSDVARGLSPAQIAQGRASEFRAHPSTIYRWIAAGYAGMSNAQLRRKVDYKPRKEPAQARPTSHGPDRSYKAFSALPEEERARACEMDAVIGKAADSQCILTLYLRPCKVQAYLLLPEKTSSAVAAALDMLEKALGKELFQRLFGLILTDNGTEFSDTGPSSARPSTGRPDAESTAATRASPSRRAGASETTSN